MTRPSQKAAERGAAVEQLLVAIHLNAEIDDRGEKPDVILRVRDRLIGVEVTMYRSPRTVTSAPGKRFTQRQIEFAWECLEAASRPFRNATLSLRDIATFFRFKTVLPDKSEYNSFFAEIRDFIVLKQSEIDAQHSIYWFYQFTSPLMTKYLLGIVVNRHEGGEWDSNKTSGFVDYPADTVGRIITDKARKVKTYTKTDEIWLVINRSARPSETVLPISGVAEFSKNEMICKSVATSPFSRIYVFTVMELFSWHRDGGWQSVGPCDFL